MFAMQKEKANTFAFASAKTREATDMKPPKEEEEDFKSRPYQAQLEEIARSKNTIIHLPTGSGKTFIAISLINQFRQELLKPWGEGGKRTFFLVNTVPLVNQQRGVIAKLCAIPSVAGYNGEHGVDYWDKNKWDSELAEHQVIVMTSQILADMLTHSYIRIEDINLLIFDECHHAVVDHPMRLVMKHFEGVPVESQPRVLGLTATLLNCNVSISKVEETLHDLETTFHATIATVNELGEVLSYSTNPRETIVYHRSPQPTDAAIKAIHVLNELAVLVMMMKLPSINGETNIPLRQTQRDISNNPKKIVKEVKNMVISMILFIEELGIYGGALSILAYIILLERLKRKAASAQEENLYKLAITDALKARIILLDAMQNESGYEKVVKHSSERVLQLLSILKEFNPATITSTSLSLKINVDKQPLSALIFTKQRFTAKVLYNLLKEVVTANPNEFGFLKHDFIVGFNINPYKCTREQYFTKKTAETALLKFCNKELNCLFATSVLEEGVDVRQCMLVVRYDAPMEYRSYIQSKGRARNAISNFVMMVNEENKERFLSLYQGFQSTERYIQKMLVGNTDDRDAPTQEAIMDSLYNDEIPPYITPLGAKLSAVQAISLLNRYCSVLAHDQFTVITPMWIEEKVYDAARNVDLLQVQIYMPVGCPVKDVIVGKPMFDLKNAKRSAALRACIRLHQEGELDPVSLLPRSYGSVDFNMETVQECFPLWPWKGRKDEDGDFKPGSTRRVRKHLKIFPMFLRGLSEWSGKHKFYLHAITLKTEYPEPTDSRENCLYKLMQQPEGYGFLTMGPLPKLCDFPMFLTVGEVSTSIKMNHAVIPLDQKLFEVVKKFHYFVFSQVLQVGKKFTVFDGSEYALYVVPINQDTVNGGYTIDWNVMQTHTSIAPVVEPTAEERKTLKVTPEAYVNHVVSPWYRASILPSRYIVSKVLEYRTASSPFTSSAGETMMDYYLNKYNLEILGDVHQPLLEVRNITSRLNCLVPRAATIKSFTEREKRLIAQAQGDDKTKGFTEEFIPEFCIKYDYPGVLWYKALILPSIVHRVTMLLTAYELRAEIAVQSSIGVPHLPKGQEWKPIEVNELVVLQSLSSLIEEPSTSKSVDRINNPIDESAPRPQNPISMSESLFQLQKKKLAEKYNWDETLEPIDIERNVTSVTVMDIECYDEFVSVQVDQTSPESSPVRYVHPATAILPPPLQTVNKITILSKEPSERGPELRDVLAALTTIKSHDLFDFERVETLGDSFLKFAASLYLSHKFPKMSEGQLSSIKGRFVGNRNLYYAGERANLGGRMKVEHFGPRNDFLVPGFFAPREIQAIIEEKKMRPTCLIGLQVPEWEALSGKLSAESRAMIEQRLFGDEGAVEAEPIDGAQPAMQCYVRAQAVADKSIADCVEGLVGTYLLSDGILAAIKVLEFLQVLPREDNFADILNRPVSTVVSQGRVSEDEIERVMKYWRCDIEHILQYRFKDPALLLEALSHSSYIKNRYTRSYERLEFLGDAILDFLITTHIYEVCPMLKPGDLTDLRSALVNNVTFASYVVRLGLHKYLCYQLNPNLERAIMAFIEHQERRDHTIVEDVLYLIDENDCQIAEYVDVPKVLSDMFESLAGAIYLDSGGNLERVWEVYYRIMCREIQDFSLRIPKQPVRVLYEKVHVCPSYGNPILVEHNVHKVMIPITFTKNGKQHTVHGFGNNKFQAKRAAAKIALKILEYSSEKLQRKSFRDRSGFARLPPM